MSDAIELEIAEPAELVAVIKASGVSALDAQLLNASFSTLFAQARGVIERSRSVVVTDVGQKLEMKLARECRLELRRIRVEGEKTKKSIKEDSLRRGKAIDGFYNILADLTGTEEKRLEEQEKFAERKEAERLMKIKAEREELLRPFGINTSFYDLAQMPDAAWNDLLNGAVAADKAKKEQAARVEAERIAREKAEAEERERIRQENEQLKQEAFEREKAAQAEREKAAAEKRAAEEKARIEREKIEAEMRKQREEADRQRREAEAKARAEREAAEAKARAEQETIRKQAEAERKAREAAEAEARRLREAEEARIAAEEAARKKAARAPDREKVKAFAASVRSLEIPKASTPEGQAVVSEIAAQVERFAAWLERKGAEL